MKLARVLGAIGRALISAGVIVLLFVAYQLWGTGLQHSQAQGSLEDDFLRLLDSDVAQEAQLASTEADGPSPVDDAPAAETEATDDPVDEPVEAQAPEPDAEITYSPEFLEVLYPAEGESLARVRIPAINVDQIVVAGVSVEDLRKGPGHYPSTPNPGQAGNSAIAGHRTTYGAPFHRVDELLPGDEIIVTTIQGSFTYRVRANQAPDGTEKGHFIVSPSDTWVLGQESGENLITLTACHPKYSARQRIIVQAELVGEPAPTPPRPDDQQSDGPAQLDAGAEDEAGGDRTDERAIEAPGDDVAQVIGDDVAADDDPSVDAEGNPIDAAAESSDSADAAGNETDAVGETGAATDAVEDLAETVSVDEDGAAEDEIELTAGSSPFSEDDFGEGLNGDRTKIRPAIMWGIAGGAIWLAAWFIGRQLDRKWTLYLLGLVPFAPVLWSCFVNIDQALPSY